MAIFIGMGLVTYIPRMLPLVALSKRPMPELLLRWLKYVPPAVLAALLAPDLFLTRGQWNLSPENLYLLAAIPTFGLALLTRNLVVTVAAGMALVVMLRLIA